MISNSVLPGSSVKMVRSKITNLLKDIFSQGISPKKLAVSISLGIFIGTAPVIWGSTALCAALAFKFRLNQPGIQAANYLAYPFQIALIVPFYRMGARLFPWGPSVSVDLFLKGIRKDWIGNIAPIIVATLKALAVWLLVAAPLSLLFYFLLLSIFARMPRFNDVSDTDIM
jgi:uncharacterized protein (DUF2062 family)